MPKVFNVDGLGPPRLALDAAGIGTALAFLNAELEKRDPRLLEPLASVTFTRDIVVKTGGGWDMYSSQYFSNYGTTGSSDTSIGGAETNDIPVMQADVTKDVWKIHPFEVVLRVPFVDQARLQGIGRSLDAMFDQGIRLHFNKTMDSIVYIGRTVLGEPGLVNAPNVTASTAPNGASGYPQWSTKTPTEIMSDVNQLLNDTWAAAQYDLSGMANHVLIPPAQWAIITAEIVSTAGSRSILDYMLKFNVGQSQGRDLVIAPSRWCIGAGAGSTDRMVAYVNDEDRVNIDLAQPLGRVMTAPSVAHAAYDTLYAANIGQVKILYPQTMAYLDGI